MQPDRQDEAERKRKADAAALVAEFAYLKLPAIKPRRSLEQMVRDSGFSDAGELAPVLVIDGRAYR